jgi:dolichol kinase
MLLATLWAVYEVWEHYRARAVVCKTEGPILRFMHAYIARASEKSGRTTIGYVIGGFLLVVLLQIPMWICGASALLLAVVDTFAKLGKQFPFYRFPNEKSLGGMIFGGMAGAAVLAGMVAYELEYQTGIIPSEVLQFDVIVPTFVVGVLAAVIAEFFAGKRDNFFIPVVAAIVMTGVWAVL